ncbi:hypothetical protein GJAV_G00165750, partial [Gymnothorax javanicus]
METNIQFQHNVPSDPREVLPQQFCTITRLEKIKLLLWSKLVRNGAAQPCSWRCTILLALLPVLTKHISFSSMNSHKAANYLKCMGKTEFEIKAFRMDQQTSFMTHWVFRVVMAWYMGVKDVLYTLTFSFPSFFMASSGTRGTWIRPTHRGQRRQIRPQR